MSNSIRLNIIASNLRKKSDSNTHTTSRRSLVMKRYIKKIFFILNLKEKNVINVISANDAVNNKQIKKL